MALPAAEQKSPETIVAKQTAPEDLAEGDVQESTVEALSPGLGRQFDFAMAAKEKGLTPNNIALLSGGHTH